MTFLGEHVRNGKLQLGGERMGFDVSRSSSQDVLRFFVLRDSVDQMNAVRNRIHTPRSQDV